MKAKNRQLKQLLANFLLCFECKCNGSLFLPAILWSATTNFPPVSWLVNLYCYIARLNTKRDWLIFGHVTSGKCNVSRRATSEHLLPAPTGYVHK
jgi:hypothetical protein